jgi:UDP-N-acetylmuramate--alanine ligase
LIDQFATSFAAADLVIVTEIYAASETPIPGITGQMLARRIEGEHNHVLFGENLNQVVEHLKSLVKPGDVVITQGAGNIWQVGPELLKHLKAA